jgi:hypothetical protein
VSAARARLVFDLPGLASAPLFSDDGMTIAYNLPTGLMIRDMETNTERAFGGLVPMRWLADNRTLVVVADYQPRGIALVNDAFLLDVTSGARKAIPALSNHRQFWRTDDPDKLVVLTYTTDLGLTLLDISTQRETPIVGSSIHYPSEGIPANQVAVDGERIYWFDATGAPSAWYVANIDGSGLKKLGEVEGYFFNFSPSASFIVFPRPNGVVDPTPGAGQSELVVSTIDSARSVNLGPVAFGLAWRPPSASATGP